MLPAARTRIRIFAIAAAGVLLTGGGFAAGRLTAPGGDSSTAECAEPRKVSQEYLDAFTAEQEVAEKRTNGRMVANTILQNPDCFGASERASAQTILDNIDQGVQEDAFNDLQKCVDDATDDFPLNSC
ncbi:hypothetical protein [Streptomyces sp. NPDC058614]|uniref:hypothetical protein n=1 Tax=Streptomyces sp. NPDC058614 TaxID=3346557 RepID=UPI0036668B32